LGHAGKCPTKSGLKSSPAAIDQLIKGISNQLTPVAHAVRMRPSGSLATGTKSSACNTKVYPLILNTGFMHVPAILTPSGKAERSTNGMTSRRR
jgi:hypothetical protein